MASQNGQKTIFSGLKIKKAFLFCLGSFCFHLLFCPVFLLSGMFFSFVYNLLICFLQIMLFLFREDISENAIAVTTVTELIIYSLLISFCVQAECGAEFILIVSISMLFFLLHGKKYFKKYCNLTAFVCFFLMLLFVILNNTSFLTKANFDQEIFLATERYVKIYFRLIHYVFCYGLAFFALIKFGNYLLKELSDNAQAIVAKNLELNYISNHDPLTKLLNRRKTLEYIKNLEEEKLTKGKNWSVCIFDIDDFKSINDRFGHDCGDVVLKSIAQLVNEELSPFSEIILSRWGGEEFLIVFPYCGKSALERLEIIRKKIPEKVFSFRSSKFNHRTDFEKIILTATFGYADSESNLSGEKMINLADKNLRLGKTHGKNCIVDSICASKWESTDE